MLFRRSHSQQRRPAPHRVRPFIATFSGVGLAVVGLLASPNAIQAADTSAADSKARNSAGVDDSGFIPIAIFGTDDRVPVPQKYQSIQDGVGVLFNLRAKTVCTAFCVDDSIIATAGHCIYRPDAIRNEPLKVKPKSPVKDTANKDSANKDSDVIKPARLADFWFARGYDATRDYARIAGYAAGAAAQNVLAGNQKLRLTPPIDATSDWALIRVARPICAKRSLTVEALSPADVMSRAAAGKVFQVSYHRDYTQWRPAYSKPCDVKRNFETTTWETIARDFSDPQSLLLHTCDTGGASSGSPLFVDSPTGPKVIGINVGTYVQSRVWTQNGQTVQRLKPETVANTGVGSIAFADKLEIFKSATILTAPAQLRELQVHLLLRQLYTGATDGTYGPALKASIEAYERQLKRPVTGLATLNLLRTLQTETSNIPSSSQNSTQGSSQNSTQGGVKLP
jgi:V8-like Glu-specific endopeptidase